MKEMRTNKHATGKAIRGAHRVRHRGRVYWVRGSNVYAETESGLHYMGWLPARPWGDERAGIDQLLTGPHKPELSPSPKSRRFGKIRSYAVLQMERFRRGGPRGREGAVAIRAPNTRKGQCHQARTHTSKQPGVR